MMSISLVTEPKQYAIKAAVFSRYPGSARSFVQPVWPLGRDNLSNRRRRPRQPPGSAETELINPARDFLERAPLGATVSAPEPLTSGK